MWYPNKQKLQPQNQINILKTNTHNYLAEKSEKLDNNGPSQFI